MAVLGSTNLTGCNSIPDFIAGGSLVTFQQTSAPTSWKLLTTPLLPHHKFHLTRTRPAASIPPMQPPFHPLLDPLPKENKTRLASPEATVLTLTHSLLDLQVGHFQEQH